ncbi:MAG: cupredoxin domain-containing protein [Myxococcales bacterium]|nr:cupredoxin domain-containing protein [Myxococcales bacterium]MDH5307605.1 cupredoxin domain-containing protein [Myxococcales bacterium]MDH5567089.1 cupredoxin domain-containing protein [Myxococcales bacterium]
MRFGIRLTCAVAALGVLAVGGPARAAEHESKGRVIQVVSAVVGGKNVFIPSTIVVAEGVPNTLSIFNTTDKPHGFRIPALKIEAVLAPQEETRVELPALEGGEIFEINCHLHPPHRTATLVVLDGD